MFDVTRLCESDLDILTEINNTAVLSFRTPKDRSSASKQRRVRKLVEKKFTKEFSALSTEIATHINTLTDEEFFNYLQAGHNERLKRYRAEDEGDLEKLSVFGDKVLWAAAELTRILEFSLGYSDGTMVIMVNEGAFYIRLKLHGVTEFADDFKIENAYFATFGYNEETGKYILTADSDDGTVSFSFNNAEAEFLPCSSLRMGQSLDTPWTELSFACYRILHKSELVPELLNDKEKELLPLIREVSSLVFVVDDISFTILRTLAHKHGLKKIVKILSKAENNRKFDFRRTLLNKLNNISSIKMWREIYDMIADAERDYPTPTECTLDPTEVSAVRESATQILYDRGYSGAYPCFTKPLKPRKFLCFLSHGMPYIAFFEKKMQARVCFSEMAGGIPLLLVNSGTVFYRKNELVDDYYSFAFHARGRRYFASSGFTAFRSDNDKLEKVITVVAKKAEFEKLSDSDREHSPIKYKFPWKLFWFILLFSILVSGGLFFIGMTLFTMILELSTSASGWTAAAFMEFWAGFPLLKFALGCFLGFGGLFGLFFGLIMAVLAYLSNKK